MEQHLEVQSILLEDMDNSEEIHEGCESDVEDDSCEVRRLAHLMKTGIKYEKLIKNKLELVPSDKAKEEFLKYITKNFVMKECAQFLPRKKKSPICKCGEDKSLHWSEAPLLDTPERKISINIKPAMVLTPDIVQQELVKLRDRKKVKKQKTADPEAPPPTFKDTQAEIKRSRENLSHFPLTTDKDGLTFVEVQTNAFGKVEFANRRKFHDTEFKQKCRDANFSSTKPAKYIRISDMTPPSKVMDLMMNYWKMNVPDYPSLVISVNGGAKNFTFEGKRRTTFNKGLVKAANATNAWIITTGCDVGVMKAVGEAVYEGQQLTKKRNSHTLRCIGITPWGAIENRNFLVNEEGQGSWPATYRVNPVVRYGRPVSLNPNHTHFLLVDDGYRNRFRSEIAQFRAKLERYIATGDHSQHGIPVVIVLVEGGLDALDFAYESVRNGIPLVLCEGTGRAADIISYAFKHHVKVLDSEGLEKRILTPGYREKAMKMLHEAYGKTFKSSAKRQAFIFEEHINLISECCQKENLITVFDINEGDNFDLAILSALLKSHTGNDFDQLKLALKWNRPDIAEENFFRRADNWDWLQLEELMTEALIDNKPEFVRLLLEQGVVMRHYLTVTRLRTLYNATPPKSFVRKLLRETSDAEDKLFLCDVKVLLQSLLDHVDLAYGLDEHEKRLYKEGKEAMPRLACYDTTGMDEIASIMPLLSDSHFMRPFEKLFLWAVLLNRTEMARLFWERDDNPVITALVATNVFKGLYHKVDDKSSEIYQLLKSQKMKYEMLATEVINEAHKFNPEKALVIIERPYGECGYRSCLQMAALAFDRDFLSTPCCQTSIEQTWKRGLRCSPWQVLFGVLCPLYIVCCLPFDQTLFEHKRISVITKLKVFYQAPVTKFFWHLLFYIFFLVLYSYVILFDLKDEYFSVPEIVLHVWVFSIVLTEIYQKIRSVAEYKTKATVDENQTLVLKRGRTHSWFWIQPSSFWIYLTVLPNIFHLIGFILRLAAYSDKTKDLIRFTFCSAATVFCFRIFRFYMASSYFGPKLFLIKKMFRDVFMFLMIVVVMLLSYSIATQAMIYPERPFYWGIFGDLVYYPFWQLFGEMSLEQSIEGVKEGCSAETLTNEDGEYCPRKFWPATIFLAAYVFVGNILMVNLLIAIFTYVFDDVQKRSTQIWKFEMWILATMFDNMPVLPPPLNFPEIVIQFFKWIITWKIPGAHSTVILNERQCENLQIFEKECANEYLRSVEQSKTAEIGYRVEQIEKHLEHLSKRFEVEIRQTTLHIEDLHRSISESQSEEAVMPRSILELDAVQEDDDDDDEYVDDD